MFTEFLKSEDVYFRILLFLFPIFFLIVRGWTNTIGFLIGILAIIHLVRNFNFYFFNRDRRFWCIQLAIVGPFIAEILAQVGQQSLNLSSLDGPSRFLLASLVFVFLSRSEFSVSLIRSLSWGSLIGVVLVAMFVLLHREFLLTFHDRRVSFFLDPIVLPGAMGLLALFSLDAIRSIGSFKLKFSLGLSIFLSLIYVILCSESRTPLLAMILSLSVFISLRFRKIFFIVFILFITSLLLIGAQFKSGSFQRLTDIETDLVRYISGDPRSSVGERINLVKTDIEIIKLYPFFGVSDRNLPAFDYFEKRVPTLDEKLYQVRVHSGGHTQLFGMFARRGIFGGGISVIALFVFPIFLVLNHRRSSLRDDFNGVLFISAVICFFTLGLGMEFFALKMTSMFWAISSSVFFSYFYSREEFDSKNKCLG